MKLSQLRGLRIFISLFFFLVISVLFLDLYNLIPKYFADYILYLQFIPSLFKFINLISVSAAGFGLILLLTFLFGRVYCSSICPLGILQDFTSRLSKRINKKKYYRRIKDYKWLKYSILVLTVVSFFLESLFLITLLDPFSNFGRILSNLFKPVIILINNFLAVSFEKLNFFFLYPIEIKNLSIVTISVTSLIFLLVIFFAFNKGRLFCNTVCPVGTLLGLISKFSLFKIQIDEEKCNSCNLCTKVCKSGCIDKKEKEVDFSRCVACYNCFNVCPTGGISYKNSLNAKAYISENKFDPKRRELISKTFLYFISLTGFSLAQVKIIPKQENKIPVIKISCSSPPGSQNIEHFTNSCTGCHLCVSACPTQVLQPSLYEYGILGILQPYMDYKTGFCNFECKVCIDVCPSGAILPLALENKKLTQIGKVKFVKENCIVEIEKTECGACSEHCPTKAVKMIKYNNLHLPEVKEEYCIGCGACEFACPTKPYKAIYVEGNPIHLTAKKLVDEKLDEKLDLKEEFPF
jgi:ferredoxin